MKAVFCSKLDRALTLALERELKLVTDAARRRIHVKKGKYLLPEPHRFTFYFPGAATSKGNRRCAPNTLPVGRFEHLSQKVVARYFGARRTSILHLSRPKRDIDPHSLAS